MKKTFLIVTALLAVLSCSRTPELVILHTNDTHSHLEPMRSGSRCGEGGVIERAAFVDSVRNAVGESKVLLLHAGDFSQGSSYFTEYGGYLEIDLVNALRYDCVTLGNHEFDNGIEGLADRLKNIECPVVCANLDLSPFELGQYVKPYVILEKGGKKIGIIGLETDLTTNVSKIISSRIPQLDPVGETNRYAALLKAEDCDLVILLSHLGYQEDLDLVTKVRNVDLVVGGHSHTFIDGMKYVKDLDGKKVPVVTDGCFGFEMGEVRIY